jgi:hypothetical protein
MYTDMHVLCTICRGRHVVITGHISVPSMSLLVEELYSTQDYGYSDFNLVFLSPEAPSDELKRLLKTHKQSHRMLYMQGSCMKYQVRALSVMHLRACQ